MIIDRVSLSNSGSYLRDQNDLNLAVSANHRGISRAVPEGMAMDIGGIWLLIRANNLLALYPRNETEQEPLLSISVRKEMFPGYFDDPYANRVHTIAGFEDFQRGASENIRPMEVEGRATLVTLGPGDCSWRSPVYHLPEPMSFRSAAWEIAASRLTLAEAFDYTLMLSSWDDGQDPATDPPTMTQLAPDPTGSEMAAKADDPRFYSGLALDRTIAYQLKLQAQTHYDTYLTEYQIGAVEGSTLGWPLLRAFHLLEPIESKYTIHSLAELETHCSDFTILEVTPPLQTLSVRLDMTALLTRREEVTLEVRRDVFELCEARLDAEVRVRPPTIARALET